MTATSVAHMLSRENVVILAFMTSSIALLFGATELSDPPTWTGGAILIGVGVVTPLLVNGYLDRRAT
jgi:hypothetical protein